VYALMTSSSLVAPQDITLHLETPIAGSLPHSILNTMSFVKLSIFGTSFEVHLLLSSFLVSFLNLSQVTTRYVDLQPVGMGPSFPSLPLSLWCFLTSIQAHSGWCGTLSRFRLGRLYINAYIVQLCEGSTHRRIRRHKKDHETLQHSCPV